MSLRLSVLMVVVTLSPITEARTTSGLLQQGRAWLHQARAWTHVTRALYRGGVTEVAHSSTFTRGSYGGGTYVPGMRTEAGVLAGEVHTLRKLSDAMTVRGDKLSFFADGQLVGTFVTKVGKHKREAVVELAPAADGRFHSKTFSSIEGIKGDPDIASQIIRGPGKPHRRIVEFTRGGSLKGRHTYIAPDHIEYSVDAYERDKGAEKRRIRSQPRGAAGQLTAENKKDLRLPLTTLEE